MTRALKRELKRTRVSPEEKLKHMIDRLERDQKLLKHSGFKKLKTKSRKKSGTGGGGGF